MKKITDFNLLGFIILGVIIVTWVYVISIFVGGCDSSSKTSNYSTSSKELHSGQSVTLKADTLVSSSKENDDKLMSYINKKNKDGENQMLISGQATILKKGTKVNIISIGITTEIEVNGEKWYAPLECFQ
ncbi:hypothetical protein CDLVIII_3185 [Clostridium sp. DL-VIII]|uniref:hypothetical protein n=1 Tax=Clostridium sp. DL-VIII TaxID=641107 RepID=UPI00023AFFBF|nr:hypothetical protein [Clostridium sp. DL-VIII]EHI99760.1 hypothetical protein CDLVIII_3185 [Clostridium sp. DL-VIII]